MDNKRSLAQSFYEAAQEVLLEGDVDEALDRLDQALQLDPEHLESLLGRASIYLDYDEAEKAQEDLDRATVLAPDSPDVRMLQGNLLRYHGKFDEALSIFDSILQSDPDGYRPLYARAVTKDLAGDPAGALVDFNRCLELRADFVPAWYDRGVLQATEQRWEEAIADYSRAVELDPSFFEAWITRADALTVQGDYARALEDLQKAIDLAPENGLGYYYRSLTYSAMGESDSAQRDYQTALDKGFDPEIGE